MCVLFNAPLALPSAVAIPLNVPQSPTILGSFSRSVNMTSILLEVLIGQTDLLLSHSHSLRVEFGATGTQPWSPGGQYTQLSGIQPYWSTVGQMMGYTGGSENRPKALTVNHWRRFQ